MRSALVLFLIPFAFLTTSCAPSAPVDSRVADAAAIQALDERWSATAAKNDLAGTVAFYADDGVPLPPNAPIATDAKSIRESWAALLRPNTAVSWKLSKGNRANLDIFTERTRCRSGIRKGAHRSMTPAN